MGEGEEERKKREEEIGGAGEEEGESLHSPCGLLCGDMATWTQAVGQLCIINKERSLLPEFQLDIGTHLGEQERERRERERVKKQRKV